MCTSSAKGTHDRVLRCFPILWCVCNLHYLTNSADDLYKSDLLAFALIVSSTAKLKTTGIKASVLLATIVEDSTLYFLFTFASQFVFIMTLILGRVSMTVPDSPPGLQLMTPNVCFYRSRSDSFQGCKSLNNLWVRPFLPCFISTIPSGNIVCLLHLACALFSDGLPSVSDFFR